MPKIGRNIAVVAMSFALFASMIVAANAAGALAVGSCGAYGYGFDYTTEASARGAAMRKCTGANCRVVGMLHRACAAMSVDAKNPCGSFGWAIDSHLGKAENISVRRCVEYGGHDCVIRAWACDEKG
jgi:Domain of unknown function (DUF4189)